MQKFKIMNSEEIISLITLSGILMVLYFPFIYFKNKWLNVHEEIPNKRIHQSLIVAPFIYMGIIFFVLFFSNSNLKNNSTGNEMTFNYKIWSQNIDQRKMMLNDLLERKILEDKTKKEIIKLLGKDFDSPSNTQLAYAIEKEPIPDILLINFNDGIVSKIKHIPQ